MSDGPIRAPRCGCVLASPRTARQMDIAIHEIDWDDEAREHYKTCFVLKARRQLTEGPSHD